MSGGRFDYANDRAASEIFGWQCDVNYDLGNYEEYKPSLKRVRKINPMHDRVISEITFDIFCLLHSLDWAESGDTDYAQYQRDVAYFKEKWLKPRQSELIQRQVDDAIADLREELCIMIEQNKNDKEAQSC